MQLLLINRVRAVTELTSVKHYMWIGFVPYTLSIGYQHFTVCTCMTNKIEIEINYLQKKLNRN